MNTFPNTSPMAGGGFAPLKPRSGRRLKVLHLAVNVERRRGGTAQAPLTVCRALRELGVDAHMACGITPGAQQQSLARDYPDVPTFELEGSFPSRFHASSKLRDWLYSEVGNYDLVEIHEMFSFPPNYGHGACVRRGVPYLLNTHGALNPSDLRKRKLLKFFYRRPFLIPLIRDAIGLKATTEYEIQTMRTYVKPPPVHLVPLPVEPPPGGDGAAFRAKHGIPANAVVLGCVGRIDEQKALELLIPAFAAFRKAVPSAWLLLVGKGSPAYTASIQQLIAKEGVSDCTTMPGWITGVEKSNAMAAYDLYTQVSWRENFCIAVAEAMGIGKPCVVSDQVGLASNVLSAKAGYGCQTSVESVLASFTRAWSERHLWPELGRRGKQHFESELTISATTPRLIELYERILARR
jgi:glycosyltransferase involved in cell wall biosynthesis